MNCAVQLATPWILTLNVPESATHMSSKMHLFASVCTISHFDRSARNGVYIEICNCLCMYKLHTRVRLALDPDPHTHTHTPLLRSHNRQYMYYCIIATTNSNYIARAYAPIFEFTSQPKNYFSILSSSFSLLYTFFNFEFTAISGDGFCIIIYNDPIRYAVRPNKLFFFCFFFCLESDAMRVPSEL